VTKFCHLLADLDRSTLVWRETSRLREVTAGENSGDRRRYQGVSGHCACSRPSSGGGGVIVGPLAAPGRPSHDGGGDRRRRRRHTDKRGRTHRGAPEKAADAVVRGRRSCEE